MSIIWVHAGRSAEWSALHLSDLGRWGTTYLNLIAGFFMVLSLSKALARKSGMGGLTSFTHKRLFHILAPFVVWSVLYVLARGVNYVMFGKVTGLRLTPDILIYGTTHHLWFLPYLAAVSLLILPVVYACMGSAIRQRVLATVLIVTAIVLTFAGLPGWLPQDKTSVTFLITTVFLRSPAFLIGTAFGLLYASNLRLRISMPVGISLACIAVFAGGCATAFSETESVNLAFCRVAAVCAFLAAMMPWRESLIQGGAKLGALGFGVYLCHLLFVEAGHSFVTAMKLPTGIGTDMTVFVLAVVASFATAAAMKRCQSLRWLVP